MKTIIGLGVCVTSTIALALPTLPALARSTTPASTSAHVATATNAETTCPFWSELNTEGRLAGKSPRSIAISQKMVGSVGSSTEWEAVGRSTQGTWITLYSGVVEVMANNPRFGLGIVRYVWMHRHGRELTARFTLEAGQLTRTVVCGHHLPVQPPADAQHPKKFTGKGSSCKKPLLSSAAQDFEHGGKRIARRHIHVSLEQGGPPADVIFGKPTQPLIPTLRPEPPLYYEVSIESDSKVVLCKAYIEWQNAETGEHGRYRMKVGRRNMEPLIVAAYPPTTFLVIAEGRYAKGEALEEMSTKG
ncbi:MAG TPA: hypothetical protein VG147_04120 [Solirubrobacteraceae bacterium]|nr:hypothetical protein [Solirubrobacteraceae bacterium]